MNKKKVALGLTFSLLFSFARLAGAQVALPTAAVAPAVMAPTTSALPQVSIVPDSEDTMIYPYIAPSGNCPIVTSPDNSGGYLFSKDCKTLFINPPRTGSTTVSAVMPSILPQDCDEYRKRLKMIDRLHDMQMTLWDDASKTATGKEQKDQDNAQATLLQTQIDAISKSYGESEGGRLEVTYSSNSDENFLQNWAERNLAIIQQGLRILPSPVSESYYSFTGLTIDDRHPKLASIISMMIPGIATNATGQTIIGGESISGQVVLSVAGACSNQDTTDTSGRLKVLTSALNNALVVNRTYSLPVRSAIGYNATLDVANAIRALGSSTLLKGQFTQSVLQKTLDVGGVNDVYQFHLTGVEQSAAQNPLIENMGDELRVEVLKDFTERLTKFLVDDGVIKLTDVTQAAADVAGGFSNGTATHWVCHDGGWFHSDSCGNETYTIPVWNDGVSNRAIQQEDTTSFRIEDHVSVDTTIYRPGTQTFNN